MRMIFRMPTIRFVRLSTDFYGQNGLFLPYNGHVLEIIGEFEFFLENIVRIIENIILCV
jgi:hypothetical protein